MPANSGISQHLGAISPRLSKKGRQVTLPLSAAGRLWHQILRPVQVRRKHHRGKYAAKRRRPAPQLVAFRHVRHGIDSAMRAGLIIR